MDPRIKTATGPTILLHSGAYFDLLDPHGSDFTIGDIAHGLSVALRRTGTHHHALDDAVTQAEHLGRINRQLSLNSDQIVAANAFLTHMAERYRERTARRVLGFRLHTMSRSMAMQFALGTFDFASEDVPFGDPSYGWDRDHARELVDSDLQHWEA